MVNDCLKSEPPRDPSIEFGLAKAREVLEAGCPRVGTAQLTTFDVELSHRPLP
jgi:hypothetical protein